MNPRPFIIWTLQRTGGTNLAQHLVERSGLPGTQHEPFNVGRVFGEVTRRWSEIHDHDALARDIKEIVNSGVIIKHCVEMVPWEVTQELAKASCEAGYRHLFLYRQNPVGRLLSLQFAKMSGIWGPSLKNDAELNEKIFSEPLPVKDLVSHENRCANMLTQTWAALNEQGCFPFAISFEELYQSDDFNAVTNIVLDLLAYLGMSKNDAIDRQFVKDAIGTGDQGTRDKYTEFEGIERLSNELENSLSFTPGDEAFAIRVEPVFNEVPWVVFADIDTIPDYVSVNQRYSIQGVVVLGDDVPDNVQIVLCDGLNRQDVMWGIESPWIAKQYPEASNSKRARFKIRNVQVLDVDKYRLCLIDDAGNENDLFHINMN